MSTTDELAKKARFLRNAAPHQFQEFFGAFAEYTERQCEILLQTTENWQRAQGHAQQCRKILDVLDGVRNG